MARRWFARTRTGAGIVMSLAVVGGALWAALPAAGQAAGLPAQVDDYEPPVREESYRYTAVGNPATTRDDKTREVRFRVVERTGNCCENYITISSKGRLFDIGGRYVNFTDDNGATWKSVRPINPLVNGEGAIAMAPNGDVVAVEWDPYSADHLLSYKFDAKAGEWLYMEMPLHTPFYDRPWVTVVPGPFVINGEKVPYVSMVDGYPHRGTFLYSTDGLTYVETSNPFIDQRLRDAAEAVRTKGAGYMDWIAPNSQSPIVPLGGGSALAQPGPFAPDWSVFDPQDRAWHALPGVELPMRLQVDSRGWMHAVAGTGKRFDYRISTDGGKTWTETEIAMPEGYSVQGGMMNDLRVNGALGLAAIGMHVKGPKGDGDLLWKIDVSRSKAKPIGYYEVGLGDIDAAAGVGQQIRFDFETVAIFPDGRVAVSFLDSSTGPVFHLASAVIDRLGPALAIEL